MCFGFPGLALILAASAAPAEKTGMQARETKGWRPTPLTLPWATSPVPRHSTDLGVEVSAHGLLGPRLEVELSSALLFRVTHHISHCLREERTTGLLLSSLLSAEFTSCPPPTPTKDAEILIPRYL